MLHKILFLDCDGVLNFIDSLIKQPSGDSGVEPRCTAQLKRIVEATGCDIVLSSTWRKHQPCVNYLFSSVDLIVRRAVIGKTPVMEGNSTRGDEIQRWLDLNEFVGNFVIVDDEDDMGHLLPHLVQTDLYCGLTADDADRIIERLNTNPADFNDVEA